MPCVRFFLSIFIYPSKGALNQGVLDETLKQGVLDGGRDLLPPCSLQWKTSALIRCSGLMGWRFATTFVYRGMNIRNQQISALKGQ